MQIPGAGYKEIFESNPNAMLIIATDAPLYTMLDVNDAYIKATNSTREALVGKSVFEVFPGNPTDEESKNIERTYYSFEQAIKNKQPHTMSNYRYDIPIPGTNKFEVRYWTTTNTPILDDKGEVKYFIHSPINVTEQEKAKVQLLEAEERARLAVDAVGLGTYDLDLATGEMITSKIFANIFGFEEPVPRAGYVSVFHTDDLELRRKAHADAIVCGTLFYEARVIWPDESIHWARVEGKVYYNEEGAATRILGTLLDITEQKLAKEEQLKLLTLVANSVDLMSILNMDGANSYINEAGMNMLGFKSEEEVIKTPIADLHLPQDFEYVQTEVLPNVMSKGRWAGVMNVRHIHTGEVFPVYNNCIRIDDANGNPIAVGAVMRDMRPELAAKQALADSEQLLRNVTTAAPTGLWMSNKEGEVTYVNQTWINWTGIDYDTHLKKGWEGALLPEDRERADKQFMDALNQRVAFEQEFRINHADGMVHWCVASGRPQYNNEGIFTGYIGACVDITEQKHLQQQKDDFIGIASHELKTPVTSIKAYTQVLEKMLRQKGEAKEAGMIARMDAQLNRLTSLISDLLDVTKINSGKLQFNNVEFDFNEHVKDLVEDLARTTTKHTIIESFESTGKVFGDKERIGQVITNLITNAIKYSPQADKINIYTAIKNDEITFCVQDFGIGIPNDNLDKVFEQFYRVSGDKQHTFPGLGLGLYISSEIIKREGGRIWVTSEEGKGSKFCFALPRKKKSDS